MAGTEISKHPVHPGLGATATIEPVNSGSISYGSYKTVEARDDIRGFRVITEIAE